jgi:hypothetical protein
MPGRVVAAWVVTPSDEAVAGACGANGINSELRIASKMMILVKRENFFIYTSMIFCLLLSSQAMMGKGG